MKRGLAFIGIGAGLMYLFDPAHGEERRNALRDKFSGLLPKTTDAIATKAEIISTKAHDLTTKADDAAAEAITTMAPALEDGQAAGGANQGDDNAGQNGAKG